MPNSTKSSTKSYGSSRFGTSRGSHRSSTQVINHKCKLKSCPSCTSAQGSTTSTHSRSSRKTKKSSQQTMTDITNADDDSCYESSLAYTSYTSSANYHSGVAMTANSSVSSNDYPYPLPDDMLLTPCTGINCPRVGCPIHDQSSYLTGVGARFEDAAVENTGALLSEFDLDEDEF